jgi:hypothetical protein
MNSQILYLPVESVVFDITVGDTTRSINALIPMLPTGVVNRNGVTFVELGDNDDPFEGEWLVEAGHVVCEYIDEHYPK